MKKKITYKGWAISLEQLESMIHICKASGQKQLQFGVAACVAGKKIKEFVDPKGFGIIKKNKLFVRVPAEKESSVVLMSAPITTQGALFDDFPPIPPTPIQDPGGG